MRVFIAGIDGYLGWALAQYLTEAGHMVGGVDNSFRRDCVSEMGSYSAIPIPSVNERRYFLAKKYGKKFNIDYFDITEGDKLFVALSEFRPDVIVHLAEMPSAPYSMIDTEHAIETHHNNLDGTLNLLFAMRDHFPDVHLVKLGTMGEYGTPNIDIPEGEFDLEFRGRKAQVMFPRKPGSFYHATKVHDTYNIEMACRLWGLRSTDIMQGVVYGTRIGDKPFAPGLATRFDFDATFGTAINRFCAQAIIGEPITPYGNGHQKRGFLPLRDSMQCLRLIIENPPAAGEYRTVNQFEDVYDITALAEKVQTVYGNCEIRNLVNPRMEEEDHYYNPDHQKLFDLGYKPTVDMITEIANMLDDLKPHKDRILEKKHVLTPDVRWDGTKKRMEYCDEK